MKIQFLLVLVGISATFALNNGLGLTPQIGWSSWNYFACDVNETIIKEIALAMSQNGMKDAGFLYVNIDDCWAIDRNSEGVIQADPTSFPSGIEALADYVHSLGLKIGIYTDAGILTCQKRPGSYGYEQIDAQTYASWGIDYVKMDWCYTYFEDPIQRYTIMRDAINATGRDMFFSLCDWGVDLPWEWAPTVGNSWRTTGDIKDDWDNFVTNLYAQIAIAAYSGPGGWNDPDMLEVGNGGMSNIEYTSQFSLWSLLSAPLIAGNDLRDMDNETLAILSAPEVIQVNQDLLGKQGTLVRAINNGTLQVWARPLNDGSRAVVLFNTGTATSDITLHWSDIWLPATQSQTVRDLWARNDIGEFTGSYTSTDIPSHGCTMLRVY